MREGFAAVALNRPTRPENIATSNRQRSRNSTPSRIPMRGRERTGCGSSRRSRSGTRGESHPSGDGNKRRKTPDGAEGIEVCATVGHCTRHVIKPDVGEIEVQRLWAV